MNDLELAILFHHAYERLAPSVGYDTRVETRIFDPESLNGKLMLAVCAEILPLFPHPPAPTTPQPARKIGGSYQADGYIVSRFTTTAGAERVVFEFNEPKGMLHIFTPEQIEEKA